MEHKQTDLVVWVKPELLHLSETIEGGTLTGLLETQTFPTVGNGTVRGTIS